MMIVADNLHVINPMVARALQQMDAAPIQALVSRCLEAGAQAIDINSGPLGRQPEKHFTFLVQAVQQVATVPLLLDTTNESAMRAGLEACRGTAIVNGFSLEPVKLDKILPLAVEHDTDIIGYLLGPNSEVPVDEEEMMAVAVAVFEKSTAAGLDPQRLIIDPVIAPLSWENGVRHNRAVLSVLRHLPDLLGVPVRTIAGVSNLATGPISTARKIEAEQAFLPMLAAAGLEMALLNVFHEATVRTAATCSALLEDKVFAWEGP